MKTASSAKTAQNEKTEPSSFAGREERLGTRHTAKDSSSKQGASARPFSRNNIGEVLPAYRRFEQKYAMFDRPYWDPQIKPLKVFYDGFRMDKANIKGGGHSLQLGAERQQ
ncbi:MAG: hypothetical protein H6Q48_1910 [Deltaproteobacteria bacterium]|nr:hypothetical protein [Deltaproteobacteria bacterium]